MKRRTREMLRNRLIALKLMGVLTLAAPMVIYFGLLKIHGSTVRQEAREYADCWRCVCIMFYFGGDEAALQSLLSSTMATNNNEIHDRMGEHL